MAYFELPWRSFLGHQAWSWTTLKEVTFLLRLQTFFVAIFTSLTFFKFERFLHLCHKSRTNFGTRAICSRQKFSGHRHVGMRAIVSARVNENSSIVILSVYTLIGMWRRCCNIAVFIRLSQQENMMPVRFDEGLWMWCTQILLVIETSHCLWNSRNQ